MLYSETTLLQQTTLIKTTLDKAEAVIIGAGSGLSTAAGLRYDDSDFFNATFPGYSERYALHTTNEADFFQFPTPEEQYAYWTRHITAIRYNYPAGKPYLDLLHIIKDKPCFVPTTNPDGNF
jgi:NAD-dependent SIR2 family protein deacetylase